jgi:MFS family permease
MRRFALSLAALLGGFVLVVFALERDPALSWLALAFGCLAAGTGLVAFPLAARRGVERSTDLPLALVGGWTIVASRVFGGETLRWLSVAAGATTVALALLGMAIGRMAAESATDRGVAASQGPSAASDASSEINWKGPLADSYWAAAALVIFALTPYLALTAAFTPLTPVLAKSIHLSQQSLQLTSGMANAGYALGTVISVQFAQHLRGRRMLVLYAVLFVVGSVLAAMAPTPGLFIAGHILQGLCTSLMLIAAVPPLVIGWPARKIPITGVVMNLCVFGAVAAGPVIGGVQAGSAGWKPLFWVVAGVGGLALLFALLTFDDQPPQDRSAPWDWQAIALAGLGACAAFFGASELETHRLLSVIVFLPLLAGLGLVIAVVVLEYTVKRPLMPVRQIATTLPVAGITIAITAGAASVAIVELTETAFQTRTSPTHLAMLFWPELGAAAVAAAVFGMLFRTRLIALFPLLAMALLAGGAAVLTGVAHGPDALVLVGSGLVGLGVGGSVSPAMFIAGFSLRSDQIQRVFALIEFLRGTAAFLVAPVLLHFAKTFAASPTAGIGPAIWICLGLAAGGGLLAAYVMLLGRVRLQKPDLERWEQGERPAWESPPLWARLRTAPARDARLTSVRDEPAGDASRGSRSAAG